VRLRSVELQVADVAGAAQFLENVWGLTAAGGAGATRYLRATADLPHILALSPGEPAIRSITFCGPEVRDERVLKGPEGQVYRFLPEGKSAPLPADRDKPIRFRWSA
jgi:hypothetical protein